MYRTLVKDGDYDTSSRVMEPEVLAYIRKFNLYRNTTTPTTAMQAGATGANMDPIGSNMDVNGAVMADMDATGADLGPPGDDSTYSNAIVA